jgi:hypothetical protein
MISLKSILQNSGANTTNFSFAVSGATTLAASGDNSLQSGLSTSMNVGWTILLTGLTAGTNTFTTQYATSAGTATYERRSIIVQGVA